jgi:hypothetical protein
MADDMQNYEAVVTAALARDVIAGLDLAIHSPGKKLCQSLMETRGRPGYAHRGSTERIADHDAA